MAVPEDLSQKFSGVAHEGAREREREFFDSSTESQFSISSSLLIVIAFHHTRRHEDSNAAKNCDDDSSCEKTLAVSG